MLEGLDEIDWRSLNHAYGRADDVPGLIRDLTSRSKKRRDKALWELYGNIWHQHTVYEATAPAVPFLVEVAAADSIPEATRNGVLLLLSDIADGTSYLDVHRGLLEEGGVEIDEQEIQRQLAWVRSAHERVRQAADTFWGGLLDPQVPVGRRLAAAYLAARFPEEADRLLGPLQTLYAEESDRVARAAVGLTLLLLGDHPNGVIEELQALGDDHIDREALDEGLKRFEASGETELLTMILGDLVTSALSRLE